MQAIVDAVDPAQTLTGLPLVNRELARRFLPQFLKGLAIGTADRRRARRGWRSATGGCRCSRWLPTAIGLIWAAGAAGARAASSSICSRVFAVVTFVGIGVDYGIHLVHRYQERGDAERATAELAPVILVAAAITLLGYGTLVNSSYPPLRSIGIVSAVSVVTLAAGIGAGAAGAAGQRAPAMTLRSAALIPAFNEADTIAAVVDGRARRSSTA